MSHLNNISMSHFLRQRVVFMRHDGYICRITKGDNVVALLRATIEKKKIKNNKVVVFPFYLKDPSDNFGIFE